MAEPRRLRGVPPAASKEEPEAARGDRRNAGWVRPPEADIAGETNLPTHRRTSEPGAASSTLVGIAKVLPGLTALAPADDTNLRTIPNAAPPAGPGGVGRGLHRRGGRLRGPQPPPRPHRHPDEHRAVVLAGVIAYLLVQALVAAARRALRRRRAGAKVDGQDVVVVKRES